MKVNIVHVWQESEVVQILWRAVGVWDTLRKDWGDIVNNHGSSDDAGNSSSSIKNAHNNNTTSPSEKSLKDDWCIVAGVTVGYFVI